MVLIFHPLQIEIKDLDHINNIYADKYNENNNNN